MDMVIRLICNRVARCRRGGLALLLLASITLFSPRVNAASVEVELDQETIPAGEVATLTLTLEGATLRGNRPSFPATAGLQIQPQGEATEVSIINRTRTVLHRYTYAVQAVRPGDYVIGAVQVNTDNGPMRTKALRLRVTAGTEAAAETRSAFVKIEVGKAAAYIGESLPFEIQLYVEEGRDLQMPQLVADGFNLSKLVNQQPVRRTVGGRLMNLVTFRGVATPVKAGPLALGPATVQLQIPMAGNGRQDFFGFFRQYQPVKLTSEASSIQVSPLPAGAPPEFTGAVGQFEMSYAASPNALPVGDPITLKISISGEGNLESISLPKLDGWAGYKFYPPNARTEPSNPLESAGSKHFEQVVVPQTLDLKEIPEFRWAYFDPGSKAYKILKGAAIPLQLTAAVVPAVALPAFSATNSVTGNPVTSLAHIRPQLGEILTVPPPLWQHSWFLGLQVLPVGAWLALRIRRWRSESLEKNPRLLRRREMERNVQAGLKQLGALAAVNQGEPFFSTLTRVLQCQIAERLDVPESGITESIIAERLRPRGLSEDDATRLEELFRLSNQFRYAPQTSTSELTGLIPKVAQAVEALKKLND